MSEAIRLALESVPYRVEQPTRIPAQRYYDEQFYQCERERVWPHTWQMACRLEEIPEIGDWVEYQIFEKSVIVVRTASGIKAFHNACRHRGVRLANGQGNCSAQGFVCPFHGWRWNMDGENSFVFGSSIFREEDLDLQDIALVPCASEVWEGFVFINFDKDPVPLRQGLGPAAERMEARNMGQLKAEWWRSTILPVNWKLAMEAFMEGYHVMTTHPQLYNMAAVESQLYGQKSPNSPPPVAMQDWPSAREYIQHSVDHLDKLGAGMGGMVLDYEVEIAKSLLDMDIPEDTLSAIMAFSTRLRTEITEQGRARGLPVPDLNALAQQHPFKAVEYFFPNLFVLPMFSGMSCYRIRPLGPESCLFELWSLAFVPENQPYEAPSKPEPLAYDDPRFPEVPRQDYANLPYQQLGLHAEGFEFMRLSPRIEGMISNYQRLIDGYIAGLDKTMLAKAAGLACGGLDSPIEDIGF